MAERGREEEEQPGSHATRPAELLRSLTAPWALLGPPEHLIVPHGGKLPTHPPKGAADSARWALEALASPAQLSRKVCWPPQGVPENGAISFFGLLRKEEAEQVRGRCSGLSFCVLRGKEVSLN